MNIPFVDLEAQYQSIRDEIDGAIAKVLATKQFIGGPEIRDFEQSFAATMQLSHVVACANGTDALELALEALDIGVGDEVLVPSLTWISSAEAVSRVGATPIFVDILEREYTIDPVQAAACITPQTKAMIPVHLYGLPARMSELKELALKNDLKIIEDAAQAHLAAIDRQMVGQLGDVITFSFYPGKNLGAYGDAGAVGTNDSKLAEKIQKLSNHGQLKKHQHEVVGRNSRMDVVQAAILNAKLPHLEGWTQAREQVAGWYGKYLPPAVQAPEVPDGFRHVYHLFVVQVNQRDALMAHLTAAQIGCSIHYPYPLPLVPAYTSLHQTGQHRVAEKVCSRIVSLPMYPEMKEKQVRAVCESIRAFWS